MLVREAVRLHVLDARTFELLDWVLDERPVPVAEKYHDAIEDATAMFPGRTLSIIRVPARYLSSAV